MLFCAFISSRVALNFTIILIENVFVCFMSLQGGEVVQETITSNIHDDIITLEFQRTDGTLITQLIDFRSVSLLDPFPGLFFISLDPFPCFDGGK